MKPCQIDLTHFLALLAFSGTYLVVARSKKPNVLPDKASFGWYQVVLSALKLWKEARDLKPCQVDLTHFLVLLAFWETFSVVTRSTKPNVLPDRVSFGWYQVGLYALRLW